MLQPFGEAFFLERITTILQSSVIVLVFFFGAVGRLAYATAT